jgi:hypothetical protein
MIKTEEIMQKVLLRTNILCRIMSAQEDNMSEWSSNMRHMNRIQTDKTVVSLLKCTVDKR